MRNTPTSERQSLRGISTLAVYRIFAPIVRFLYLVPIGKRGMSNTATNNYWSSTSYAAAATGAASSVASIPFVGPIMAVAAVASVLAALTSLPKFANGGIAYGPTLGLFGEYAGASNNPEVVAPLNRLRQLIQPAGPGGMSGDVRFRIDGRALTGILERETNLSRRS